MPQVPPFLVLHFHYAIKPQEAARTNKGDKEFNYLEKDCIEFLKDPRSGIRYRRYKLSLVRLLVQLCSDVCPDILHTMTISVLNNTSKHICPANVVDRTHLVLLPAREGRTRRGLEEPPRLVLYALCLEVEGRALPAR
jgi:hypothetical protein